MPLSASRALPRLLPLALAALLAAAPCARAEDAPDVADVVRLETQGLLIAGGMAGWLTQDDPASADLLQGLASDRPERVEAARAALRARGGDGGPLLALALASEHEPRRRHAAALAAEALAPERLPAAARDRRVWMRRLALAAAAVHAAPPALLEEALSDDDPVVVRGALTALGRQPARTAERRDLLAQHVRGGQASGVEAAVALALEGEEGRARLVALLEDAGVRRDVPAWRAVHRSVAEAEALAPLLLARRFPVRAWAAAVLAGAEGHGPLARRLLVQALDDPSSAVRHPALWALARPAAPDLREVTRLALLLADPDEALRLAAACALAERGITSAAGEDALRRGLTQAGPLLARGEDALSLFAQRAGLPPTSAALLLPQAPLDALLPAAGRYGAALAEVAAAEVARRQPAAR